MQDKRTFRESLEMDNMNMDIEGVEDIDAINMDSFELDPVFSALGNGLSSITDTFAMETMSVNVETPQRLLPTRPTITSVSSVSAIKQSRNRKKSMVGGRKSSEAVRRAAAQKIALEEKKRIEAEESLKNEDDHPYKIGAPLIAKFYDGTLRFASIIERSRILGIPENRPSEHQWRYYIHFTGFNRRMDEWVLHDRIIGSPSVAAIELKALKEKKDQGPTSISKEGLASSEYTAKRTRRQIKKEELDISDFDAQRGKHIIVHPRGEDAHDEHHEGLDEASLKEHEEVTKVKNVNWIELGRNVMECWYFSPFPKEFFPGGYVECLYFCEHTMRFFRHRSELLRWKKCGKYPRYPPGNEIYRDDKLSMFEVDGADQRLYCQGLCYLAKLFLDHKTLYYDVDPFLFYILCERDNFGYHPVGYFSKEKYSDLGYNLACILTFPAYQRKGYGRILISFSYELSKKEEKVGSPEKPLSDLGAVSYRSYWSSVLIDHIRKFKGAQMSIMDLSTATSIMSDDVISTLQFLGLLQTTNGEPGIIANPDLLKTLALKYPLKAPLVDPLRLHWVPSLVGKKDKFSFSAKTQTKTPTVE